MPKKKSAHTPDLEMLSARPGYLVRRLNQIHYAIFFEECKQFNITPVQYGMLTALSVTPGIDQKTLGHELGLDRTNTADVLKRLEDRGLVKRVPSVVDGRVKNAFPTPEGEKVTRKMFDAMAAAQERLLAPLSAADRKKFMELLLVLVESNNEVGRASMRAF
ncbi:MarR family winged helix-turn-helix transcriptional regulator [Lacisediminimonas profundi]|uniref:MarR family winged helix-turn-helix transcriptional regulator n=1 Tax=Lacisediminimonas profundi TaxID=2603856 RepID=UPI00124B19B1|nr:MarR family winged helix-turn-helix transcriptional regulator [Lacisediminimonas profundi]